LASNKSFGECRRLLFLTGIFISNANLTNPYNMLRSFLVPALQIVGIKQRTGFAWVKPSGTDLEVIAQIINGGKICTIIDRVYGLIEVRQAPEYMESGRLRGKIAMDMERG